MIFWTIAETAKQLSVSARTVERLIEDGELPAIRIRRSRRLDVEAVQAWAKKLSDQEATHIEDKKARRHKTTSTNSQGQRTSTPAKPARKNDATTEIKNLIDKNLHVVSNAAASRPEIGPV